MRITFTHFRAYDLPIYPLRYDSNVCVSIVTIQPFIFSSYKFRVYEHPILWYAYSTSSPSLPLSALHAVNSLFNHQ